MKLFILLLGVITLLGACASPRYETAYRLDPPLDAKGKACLVQCDATLKACQDTCAQRHQACVAEVDPRVDDAYAAALKDYAADLDYYALNLQRYEFNLWLGWHQGPWWLAPGWAYPQVLPRPPRQPSREAVRDRLVKEQCSRDCGCQPPYEACFLACGGRKVPEERCVANCPKP